MPLQQKTNSKKFIKWSGTGNATNGSKEKNSFRYSSLAEPTMSKALGSIANTVLLNTKRYSFMLSLCKKRGKWENTHVSAYHNKGKHKGGKQLSLKLITKGSRGKIGTRSRGRAFSHVLLFLESLFWNHVNSLHTCTVKGNQKWQAVPSPGKKEAC